MELGLSDIPYPGLRTFTRYEYDIFFGRDDHIEKMIDKLGRSNFLCVTGPSGCGKSSLARTGLFNALEAGFLAGQGSDWVICDLSPGTRPLERLCHGLARGIVVDDDDAELSSAQEDQVKEIEAFLKSYIDDISSDLNGAVVKTAGLRDRPIVVLVDQFEEIFRYAQTNRHEAARFVDVLLKTAGADSRIFIVITVRTEELAKCARYPGLTDEINRSQFLTPTLDRYQLQEAIEGPIKLFGGQIDPRLTVWMLNDLEKELDKLPLMQHALKLLYDRKVADVGMAERSGEPFVIGPDDFIEVNELPRGAELGTPGTHSALRTAMSNRLDRFYNRLPEELKLATPRAFCALTNISSHGRDIRNAVSLDELSRITGIARKDTARLVSVFADPGAAYLRVDGVLSADANPQIDVTHECVLRLWRRLQEEWLPDEIKNAQEFKELARRARTHATQENRKRSLLPWKNDDQLLRGSLLTHFRSWWKRTNPNDAWAKRHLEELQTELQIDTTEASGEALTFEAVEDFIKESKQAENRRIGVAVAAAGLVFATLLGGGLYWSSAQQEIESSRNLAIALLVPNESDRRPTSTMQKAIELAEAQNDRNAPVGRTTEIGSKLWEANSLSYERRRFVHAPGTPGRTMSAKFLPGGANIATITNEPVLRIWPVEDGSEPVAEFDLEDVFTFRFDERDNPIQLGRSLSITPDGRLAAIGTVRGSVALVDLETGEMRELYPGPDPWSKSSVLEVDFSADGTLLAAASLDKTVRLWNRPKGGGTNSWEPWSQQESIGFGASVYSVDLSEDGKLLAAGLGNGKVCIVEFELVSTICNDTGHLPGYAVKSVRFRPDKAVLVSGGNDDRVAIWEIARQSGSRSVLLPRLSPSFLWHESDIWDLDFDPDGRFLASVSWDGSVRVFDARTWKPLSVMRGHGNGTRSVDFGNESRFLVTGGGTDNTARIWSLFVPSSMEIGFSHRMPSFGGYGSADHLGYVAFGPDAGSIAFTNGRSVFVKRPGSDVEELPVRDEKASSGDYTALAANDAGMIVATRGWPQLSVWLHVADEWKHATLPLPTGDISRYFERRPLALSRDGNILAFGVINDTRRFGVGICQLDFDESGFACNLSGEGMAEIELLPVSDGNLDAGCARQNKGQPSALALSNDGTKLAVGGTECAVRRFDLKDTDGTSGDLLLGHVGSIRSLDFSPDGKRIASSSTDWTSRIWTEGEEESLWLKGAHDSTINSARFSPSGQKVVTVSNDERLVVWDAETAEKWLTLSGHNSTILSLDIGETDDGRVLMATGTSGGEINVMQLFEDDAEVRAKSMAYLDDLEGKTAGRNGASR